MCYLVFKHLQSSWMKEKSFLMRQWVQCNASPQDAQRRRLWWIVQMIDDSHRSRWQHSISCLDKFLFYGDAARQLTLFLFCNGSLLLCLSVSLLFCSFSSAFSPFFTFVLSPHFFFHVDFFRHINCRNLSISLAVFGYDMFLWRLSSLTWFRGRGSWQGVAGGRGVVLRAVVHVFGYAF